MAFQLTAALEVIRIQASQFKNSLVNDLNAMYSAWTFFTAMSLNDTDLRDSMIDQIWDFASRNHTNVIFPARYTSNGSKIQGLNAAR